MKHLKKALFSSLLCLILMISSACAPENKVPDDPMPENSTEITDNTENNSEENTNNEDDTSDTTHPAEDNHPVSDVLTLDDVINMLDAEFAIDYSAHSGRVHAQDFLDALLRGDQTELALWFGQNEMMDTDIPLDDSTVFESYELYPIILPEKYHSENKISEDYIVVLHVLSTNSPVFVVGDNFKVLRSPAPYYLESFTSPEAIVGDVLFAEQDKDIRIMTTSANFGLFFPDGEIPSNEIPVLNFLDTGYHLYTAFYGKQTPHSLNELNTYLSTHIHGFSPFTFADLATNVDTAYFQFNDLPIPEDFNADTPLYGCTAGHGGTVYSFSYDGSIESKNDTTLIFTLYADTFRLIPAAKTEFTFDISGDTPVLLSISRKSYEGVTPLHFEV